MTATLYETDFAAWTAEQAELLQAGRLDALDIAGLIEEIEDMGKSERSGLESHLSVVLMHLLKWQFQPDRRTASWRHSILNGRFQALKRLKRSPSLRPKVSEIITDEYDMARENAAFETGLPLTYFPDTCPFTTEQVLDREWLP